MKRENFSKEVKRARLEKDVWRVINRGRIRKEKIGQNIAMKEWRRHFTKLLGGVEWRVTMGNSKNDEIEKEEE